MDKRIERHIESVTALRDYLRELVQVPKAQPADVALDEQREDGGHAEVPMSWTADADLVRALKSQGGLAKLTIEGRGIRPSSLNTIKRIANLHLDGGFDAVDRLRVAALEAIEKEKSKTEHSNKTDKRGLTRRVEEQDEEIQVIHEDLMRMSRVFVKSLRQARSYAASSGKQSVIDLCRREQRELLGELELVKNQMPSKVVSINRG